MASESDQVLLIALNVTVIALCEALARTNPSTARSAVEQLRLAKKHAKGPLAEKIRAQIEKHASMIETTLSFKPQ